MIGHAILIRRGQTTGAHMFGLLKNGKREQEFAAGVRVAAAFELLLRDAPGAAYLFARTLVNARPFIEDSTIPSSRKIEAIQAQIDEPTKASGADAGLGVLAMKFIRHLLEVAEGDVIASFGHSAAFGEIAKAGEQYRTIEPRDHQPPSDEGSRRILAKQVRICVAELADGVMAECEEMSGDRKRAEEDIATLLACFDLREEARSGRLQSTLPALEAAVGHMC